MRKRVLALLVTSVLASSTARADKPADAVDACITSSEAAQRQRAQGYLRVSRARAVECLDPCCPAEIRRDCDALITTLARLTPTVVFRVRGPDGADVAAQIEVDGQPTELDGRARALDPGPHDVSASAPGFVATRTRIIVEEGVLARVVELRPVPIPIAPAPSPVVHTSRSKLTWLASGSLSTLGVAGVGLFAGLGLSTDADHRFLRASCGNICPPGKADSVHRRFQTADVFLTAGIIAIAGAVAVYLLGPRTRTERHTQATR